MKRPFALINDFIHLVFPHVCTGCGSDVIATDHQLCLHCHSALPVTGFFNQQGNPVEQAFYGRLPLRSAASAFFFTKNSLVQHLMVQLKYRGNKDIGIYLGKILGKLLMQSPLYNSVDVLVPLPLNPAKEMKRGYNQATAICNGIAEIWERPVADRSVIRKVYTETQTHLGRINRWENIDGVFEVRNAEALSQKHILLVDDVVTTGATLEACGTEILKIPGTSLSLATLAYTI